MIVKLLTEHHLELLSLKEAAAARLSLHMSKYHIVGNHMSRLKWLFHNTIDNNNFVILEYDNSIMESTLKALYDATLSLHKIKYTT